MKILVISNFYPPYYIGGYEIGCQEAVEGLRSRGHQVKVLTSNYGVTNQDSDENIYRKLKLNATHKTDRIGVFFDLFLIEIHNHIVLQRLISNFKPDLVYVWNLAQISVSLAFKIQKQKIPLFYFIFDHWLSKWQQDPWFSLLNTPALGIRSKLRNIITYFLLKETGFFLDSPSLFLGKNVHFASQYLKNCSLEVGQSVQDAIIIPWGLKIQEYPYKPQVDFPSKLLYIGQIIHHKGVHTIIQALKLLVQKSQYEYTTLTIVGGTTVPSYEIYLKELVSSLDLSDKVFFRDFVQRKELIPIYQEHDILIFPSVWQEPFGITLLEGMALGLPIVSTNNGGSKEILRDEFNALIFSSEDYHQCAEKIMCLINDSELCKNIHYNARLYIEEKYDLNKTLNQIEDCLSQ